MLIKNSVSMGNRGYKAIPVRNISSANVGNRFSTKSSNGFTRNKIFKKNISENSVSSKYKYGGHQSIVSSRDKIVIHSSSNLFSIDM